MPSAQQGSCEYHFLVFWYDPTREINPRSTDCEADAVNTTPSRRYHYTTLTESIAQKRSSVKNLCHKKQQKQLNVDLEALSVDNRWTALVILLFRDPHLLEGGEKSQNRSSNLYKVFPFGRSNNLDCHDWRSKSSHFILHTVSNFCFAYGIRNCIAIAYGPHGTCFHAARVVSTPSNWKVSLMLCGNRMCPPGRVSTYSNVQGPANQQTSFSGRDDKCVAHKLPFSGPIIKKFRGPSILQLNIEGLTASKMNVLHHLAIQLEAFVILLQETHCISAEKLVLSNYQLAEFSLSRKHGLATFVHKRLKRTLYDQSPTTSETEWLCVDVDGYKIVNIYKPPPTRLKVSDLPVFTHPCLYAGDFNCPHVDRGYNTNSADGDCLLAWASSNNLALLHDPKDEPSFHSGRWNTGTNPDLAFTTVGPDSRLP